MDRSSAKAAWFHWGVLLMPCVIPVASSNRRSALRNRSKSRGERTIGGNSSNRAELGAACLALEDTKKQQNRKPVILLSDSACFLSSSQKWIGEGKSPSMHWNPDADIMREIIQLLRDRIEQGLLTIFIKIKAHRGDPLNELADRWADEGRQSENIRWSLPSNRPIFYWMDNGVMHRSPMNPTVKKGSTYRYLNNN